MGAWRCRLKKRMLSLGCLMILMSVATLVKVHLNQVRRERAELIFTVLGSRNTSEFVNPSHETLLVDSTKGWVAKRAAEHHGALESLIRQNKLHFGVRTQMPNLSEPPPFVLIVVVSEFGFQRNRRAIRETWYKWARRENAKVVFFLGLPPNTNTSMTELENEIRRYNDVIVDDHVESYYLLAVKVLRMLKWFTSTYPQEASRPKFLVKTDHDVFNHIPNLVKHLRTVENIPNYIGGLLHTNPPVIRNGYNKWYTPNELWPPDYFPMYVGGPCYMMAGSVVPLLYSVGLKQKLFHLEDVFLTGIVAHTALQLRLYGLPEDIIVHSVPKLKMYEHNVKHFISFHPVTPTTMHQFYRRVRRALTSPT